MALDPTKIRKKEDKGLGLVPGAPVIITPAGTDKHYKTVYVGMEPGKYLITGLPPIKAGSEEFSSKNKSQVVIQYKGHGGILCGFRSTVLGMNVAPFRHLFLEYPQAVSVLDMRDQDRCACIFSVRLFREGAESFGMMLNISRGGCMVSVVAGEEEGLPAFEAEQTVACRFFPLGSKEELTVEGRIKSITPADRKLTLGIEFETPPADVQSAVEEHIRRLTEYLEK
jgi:hypothetical protein